MSLLPPHWSLTSLLNLFPFTFGEAICVPLLLHQDFILLRVTGHISFQDSTVLEGLLIFKVMIFLIQVGGTLE